MNRWAINEWKVYRYHEVLVLIDYYNPQGPGPQDHHPKATYQYWSMSWGNILSQVSLSCRQINLKNVLSLHVGVYITY